MFKKAALPVVVTLVLAATVLAQNPRGSLRGTVQDATGARIPAARIVVESIDSSMRRETTSEDRGEFRVDDLLPGNYRITVSAAGFAPIRAGVSIAVTVVHDVTVTLKPGTGTETVTVQGNSSSITTATIDTSSAVRSGVVGSQDLQTLPLPGSKLCQYCLSRARDGTGRTFGSHEGPHHRCLDRRKFGLEQ